MEIRMGRKIHLVFLRKSERIPPLFSECERLIRNMHPSWDITRWDEETGLAFLRENLPEYVSSSPQILEAGSPKKNVCEWKQPW